MTDPQFALIAQGVGRKYPRRNTWAIRDLNLAIPQGSVAALVGPNGAGKSTLLRCFVGFERPDAGAVRVHGVDPAKTSAAAIRLIGYVPQSTALYRNFTVEDHFQFAALYRPSFDRPKAVDRLRSIGVDPSRRVGDLSGGEQAQVSLAIASAVGARVLILDEPLAHLDPLARRDFLTTLKDDARGSGATVLLSSHIVTDVQQACDWLIVLASGALRLQSEIASALSEFRTAPAAEVGQTPFVGAFLGPDGERLVLVKARGPEYRPATLEEIVLGHLASGRSARS